MRQTTNPIYLHSAGLIFCLLMLSGCGKSVGELSGVVAYQGKPLPVGQIVLYCDGGDAPVITRWIRDGAFSIDAAPVGNARVAVLTFPPSNVQGPGGLRSPKPIDVPQPPVGQYVSIPTKYRHPKTSGLSTTVTQGHNLPLHFDLAP
jgi:hypothetical protein